MTLLDTLDTLSLCILAGMLFRTFSLLSRDGDNAARWFLYRWRKVIACIEVEWAVYSYVRDALPTGAVEAVVYLALAYWAWSLKRPPGDPPDRKRRLRAMTSKLTNLAKAKIASAMSPPPRPAPIPS